MKISEDQKTITLDDGRMYKALVIFASKNCKLCAFNKFSPDYSCDDVVCDGYERKDGFDVVFKKAKNETK